MYARVNTVLLTLCTYTLVLNDLCFDDHTYSALRIDTRYKYCIASSRHVGQMKNESMLV